MRLTLSALGLELDITFGIATDAIDEDDEPTDLGYLGGTYVGFVAAHDLPDEAAIHRPRSPCEDESEA